jgi:D-glycero-D-manno-heptose 1,7-bisphosphate phosphatase
LTIIVIILKKEEGMKALFLDRDGVINEDLGYVHKREEVVFRDGIFSVLARAQQMGYSLFIVTNQSGIGRGYYTEEQFLELMEYIIDQFRIRGIEITDFAYCPHLPEENCDCRKPKPGMILQLAEKYNIDLSESVMVGDNEWDREAGERAGVGRSGVIETPFDILKLL